MRVLGLKGNTRNLVALEVTAAFYGESIRAWVNRSQALLNGIVLWDVGNEIWIVPITSAYIANQIIKKLYTDGMYELESEGYKLYEACKD